MNNDKKSVDTFEVHRTPSKADALQGRGASNNFSLLDMATPNVDVAAAMPRQLDLLL